MRKKPLLDRDENERFQFSQKNWCDGEVLSAAWVFEENCPNQHLHHAVNVTLCPHPITQALTIIKTLAPPAKPNSRCLDLATANTRMRCCIVDSHYCSKIY